MVGYTGLDGVRVRGKAGHASPAPDFRTLLGEAGWQNLAAPVRARFAAGSSFGRFEGTAELAASWIGRCLAGALIAVGRPLPTLVGEVDAQVTIRTGPTGAIWDRSYSRKGGPAEHARSVKRHHRGALFECAGPLWMRLRLEERDGALAFISTGFFLALGRLLVRLPDLLTPGELLVLHTDRGHGRFEFALTCDHPLLGRLFTQTVALNDPDMKGA